MPDSESYGGAEYLCYQILRRGEITDKQITKTEFNKLCALAYYKLEDEGEEAEVDLPFYWYMYGDRLYWDDLNLPFLTTESGGWKHRGQEVQLKTEVPPGQFDVPRRRRSAIDAAIDRLDDRLFTAVGSRRARRTAYRERAPTEFINVMDEFRTHLDSIGEGPGQRDEFVEGVDISFEDITGLEESRDVEIDPSEVDDGELLADLRTLATEYPDETYAWMDHLFYRWHSSSKDLIRYDLYSRLRSFQEQFWRTFSRVELRVRHNRNISPGQLLRWEQGKDEHMRDFQMVLESVEDVIDSHREESDILQNYSEEYDKAVDKAVQRHSNGN